MPGNLIWRSTYDTMDRKIAEWQEVEGKPFQKWEYSYQDGHLIQRSDPQNRLYQYEYDGHARLAKESVEQYTRTYTYDPRGLLTSVVESGDDISKVERAYDESGRLIEEKIFLNEILLQDTVQTWTPSSRSLQIGTHKQDFHYQAGRLSQVNTQDVSVSYEYALSGSLIKKTTPFSILDIRYNDSALPINIDVKIAANKFLESLEWTPCGKLASHYSNYSKPETDTFTYTPRGFLKATKDCQYVFDFNEPGRGIRTCSPNLEALVNGLDEFGRITKEQSEKGFFDTIYDSLGQVIVRNQDKVSWDPWGRITAITSDKYEWTASYDAFGRRLQTTHTPITSYLLFKSKEKPVIQQSFYDPGKEFAEIGVSYGDKTFWKLYGLNSCDAIVDSNGNAVVLHHDMRNNLQALMTREEIIWVKDYPTPYGPRAPPEAASTNIFSFAQSLTWQSKQMDPTGLIWLGARYYDPSGGRFFSPDPISHPVCLDLYAYANGDPINNVDLDGRFASALYRTTPPQNISTALPVVTFNESFEEMYAPNNRSRHYDLSDLGRPELPGGLKVLYLNGINNEFGYAKKTATYISDLIGGYNVHGVYGATMGFYRDAESYNRGMRYEDTGRVPLLHEAWNAHLAKYPDGRILQYVHSRGCVDARNALLCYPEDKRKQITIVAIAPGGYIYSETCAKVTHYRVSLRDDPIPYRDWRGWQREEHTIITLDSHEDAPLHDHSILSPTYRDVIKKEAELFIQNKGVWK
jgi:RHS repeat-associated protein